MAAAGVSGNKIAALSGFISELNLRGTDEAVSVLLRAASETEAFHNQGMSTAQRSKAYRWRIDQNAVVGSVRLLVADPVVVGVAATANVERDMVFFHVGQSNMVGYADIADQTYLEPVPGVQVWSGNFISSRSTHASQFMDFDPLTEPSRAQGRFTSMHPAWAKAVSQGHQGRVYLIKVALHGSGFEGGDGLWAQHGMVGHTPSALMWLYREAATALNYLQVRLGVAALVAGVFVNWGELDSKALDTAQSFGAQLAQFKADFYTFLGLSGVPFLASAKDLPRINAPYLDVIRSQLGALAQEDADVHLVSEADLTLEDGVHLSAESYNRLGQRFHQVWLAAGGASKAQPASHFSLDAVGLVASDAALLPASIVGHVGDAAAVEGWNLSGTVAMSPLGQRYLALQSTYIELPGQDFDAGNCTVFLLARSAHAGFVTLFSASTIEGSALLDIYSRYNAETADTKAIGVQGDLPAFSYLSNNVWRVFCYSASSDLRFISYDHQITKQDVLSGGATYSNVRFRLNGNYRGTYRGQLDVMAFAYYRHAIEFGSPAFNQNLGYLRGLVSRS